MASDRRYELEDLLIRPGTYFNPQTEVLVVIDDSQSIDGEIFNMEEFEGADWVLIDDDVPIDEAKRDEQLEEFQAHFHGGDGRGVSADPLSGDDTLDDDPNAELDPDEEVDDDE